MKLKVTSVQKLNQLKLLGKLPLQIRCPTHYQQKMFHIFTKLFFNMVVSNGLLFSFAENPETYELFKFCIPAVKLPSAKVLSESVLKEASKDLFATVQKDLNGVTAVDG